MSDKEPRRRKKRKDFQPPRKEDVHASDDQLFISSKSEAKDSDQELEEEILIPTHQPSVFAKFVFIFLFSGLVVSLSFIFISLHGTDRGDVDIFNGHSEEINELPHDEHDFHEHENDDHDIHDHENDEHDIQEHDEETPEEESFSENIADYFPSIGNILSFNDEHTEKPLEEPINDNVQEELPLDEQLSDLPMPSPTDEYVSSTNQDSLVDDSEEQSTESPVYSEMHPDELEEPESVLLQSDVSFEQDDEKFPKYEADELDNGEILENEVVYSDSSAYETEVEVLEPVTESYKSSVVEDILTTIPAFELQEGQLFDQDYTDSDDFIDVPAENNVEEIIYYEKQSITNEDDFKIRDQLDDLDKILQKLACLFDSLLLFPILSLLKKLCENVKSCCNHKNKVLDSIM